VGWTTEVDVGKGAGSLISLLGEVAENEETTMTGGRAVISALTGRLGTTYRDLLIDRAEDHTVQVASGSALVLAPHPDDETLACGVTIARKAAAGTPVTVVIATDGTASHPRSRLGPTERAAMRRDEARAAVSVLGLDPTDAEQLIFLDHPDGHLADRVDPLAERIDELVTELRPDEIYAPSSIDWNDDHRAMSRVVRRLVAQKGLAAKIYEYPVWFYEPWAWVDHDSTKVARLGQLLTRPVRAMRTLRPRIVKSGEYAIVKEQAVAEYRSQLTNLTGEDDWAVFPPRFLERQLAPEELFFEPIRSSDGTNPVEVDR